MKVYYGADDNSFRPLFLANVQYILISYFHYRQFSSKSLDLIHKYKSRMIDSGLFTFMFGAEAGTPMPWEFCVDWLENYSSYLKKYYLPTDYVIELDVQKKLGSEAAWELRRMLKKAIPNTVVNVYHLEDGNPDKLIEYSDYIAISQPELRKNVSKEERYKITRYISGKALLKGKRVHLLGLTEPAFMEKFRHCTSCDSTSWQSCFRWGKRATEWGVKTEFIKNQNIPTMGRCAVDRYWQGLLYLEEYKKYAGDQS